MKKKASLIVILAIVVLIAISSVWYFFPTNFLSGVEPSDIKSISVFDGNTGKGFDVGNTDEIYHIVENIQNADMRKDKLSIGYTGWSFNVKFYNEAGKEIENFIINSADTIRKDPFFYRCDDALCFNYLKELEGKYSN